MLAVKELSWAKFTPEYDACISHGSEFVPGHQACLNLFNAYEKIFVRGSGEYDPMSRDIDGGLRE